MKPMQETWVVAGRFVRVQEQAWRHGCALQVRRVTGTPRRKETIQASGLGLSVGSWGLLCWAQFGLDWVKSWIQMGLDFRLKIAWALGPMKQLKKEIKIKHEK